MRCTTSLTPADITRHHQSRSNYRSRAASSADITISYANLDNLPELTRSNLNLSKIPLLSNGKALEVYSKNYGPCFSIFVNNFDKK